MLNTVRSWLSAFDAVHILLLFLLITIGVILVFSASPHVALHLKLPSYFFFKRHIINIAIGLLMMFIFSILSEKNLKILSIISALILIVLLCAVLFIGQEVKGARRWISFFGLVMQPSEMLKPFYIILLARLLSFLHTYPNLGIHKICAMLHATIALLLLKEPDLGMAVTYTVIFLSMMFAYGISLYLIGSVGILLFLLVILAYYSFPHVANRINTFFGGDENANYQVEKALESYSHGGVFGQGPMGGVVKNHLPDCHSDFIFAVAGEELGTMLCSGIIILMFAIAFRGFIKTLKMDDPFKIYTIVGISSLFAFQSIFNIGVTLNLLPTKGMTLPFISYGGSSTFSFMISYGVLLNFTKKNFAILKKYNSFH